MDMRRLSYPALETASKDEKERLHHSLACQQMKENMATRYPSDAYMALQDQNYLVCLLLFFFFSSDNCEISQSFVNRTNDIIRLVNETVQPPSL